MDRFLTICTTMASARLPASRRHVPSLMPEAPPVMKIDLPSRLKGSDSMITLRVRRTRTNKAISIRCQIQQTDSAIASRTSSTGRRTSLRRTDRHDRQQHACKTDDRRDFKTTGCLPAMHRNICGARMPGAGRITRRLGRDRCRQQPLAFLSNHGVTLTGAHFQTVAI
jgi:hypothetical protein